MSKDASLFQALLGEAWPALAAPVRQIHGGTGSITARGHADVTGATHLAARWLRRLLGLPEPGAGQEVVVHIERQALQEVWTRRFVTGCMRSVLREGPQQSLREQLGPVALGFTLEVDGDAIAWRLSGASLLGLPLPRWSLGQVAARSGTSDGMYLFAIEARLPLLGVWIAYRGQLELA